MNRKVIDTYKDKVYKANILVHEYDNGVRVVEAIKKPSNTVEMVVIIKGGAVIEDHLKIPYGTAHVYEHIIGSNPGKRFKTREKMDSYGLGNKTRPKIMTNAATSMQNMYFYGATHKDGRERLIRSILYMLDHSDKSFSKHIGKEKQIIQSELSISKGYKASSVRVVKFLLGNVYPEVARPVGGVSKNVNKVTADDLLTYHNTIRDPKNVVICVQSVNRLTKSDWMLIDRIAKLFVSTNNYVLDDRKIYNKVDVDIFFDDIHRDDVYFAFVYLKINNGKIDYKDDILAHLSRDVLIEIARIKIREQKKLIYWVDYISQRFIKKIHGIGYKFSCPQENIDKVLEIFLDIIRNKKNDFFNTVYGKKWFNSQMSDYIYQGNVNYDRRYPEGIGMNILHGYEYKYDFDKKLKVAKKINPQMVVDYIEQNFVNTPPRIWVSSPYKGQAIVKKIKKTSFFKFYENLGETLVK